MKIKYSC